MKAVISSTYDDKYLYFLPIVTWLWNKLGVDVICFMPLMKDGDYEKWQLIAKYFHDNNFRNQTFQFTCPEHKEATYAQCSRLYAACLDLPEDEVLVTSDIDMGVFQIPTNVSGTFSILGYDLVPEGQVPMCYLTASVRQWRDTFKLQHGVTTADEKSLMTVKTKTYQNCLDEMLGHEEMENMRGNLWSRDQEIAWNKVSSRFSYIAINRAKPGTQFAEHRVDRDDTNWRSYLNENLIDAHLWRPGYTDENFPKIMELMTTMYPNEDFTWLFEYTQAYKQLVNE